jgi:predicted house-cleaning noncanonical NTP pyrophosphatase (MazG superfamily)
MIFDAYFNATRILYSTVATDEEAKDLMKLSLEQNHPINIGEYIKDKNTESSNVLCSIRTDIEVLNAISKIITIMATSNQCIVQSPSINVY